MISQLEHKVERAKELKKIILETKDNTFADFIDEGAPLLQTEWIDEFAVLLYEIKKMDTDEFFKLVFNS